MNGHKNLEHLFVDYNTAMQLSKYTVGQVSDVFPMYFVKEDIDSYIAGELYNHHIAYDLPSECLVNAPKVDKLFDALRYAGIYINIFPAKLEKSKSAGYMFNIYENVRDFNQNTIHEDVDQAVHLSYPMALKAGIKQVAFHLNHKLPKYKPVYINF